MATLGELEADPRFKSLPYALQQQMRMQWAKSTLVQDPRFQQLPQQNQQQLLSELITRAPVYEEKTDYVKNATDLALRVQKAPEENAKEAGWNLFREGAFRRLGPVSKALTNFVLDIADDFVPGDPNWDYEDFVTTNDSERKAYDYLKYNIMNNPETAPKIHMETVGTIGGTFGDLAVNWGLLKGAGAIAGGIGGVSMLAKGGQTAAAQSTAGRAIRSVLMQGTPKFTGSGSGLASAGKFGRYLHQTLIPFTAQAGRDAVIGVTQEYAQDKYEGRDWKDMGFGDQASNAAAAFGAWFAGDMLFFTALQVGKAFGGNVVNVFRRGGLRGKKTGLESMDFNETMDLVMNKWVLNKEPIPPAVWDALSDTQKGVITRARGTLEVAKNIDNFAPGSDEWNAAFAKSRGADLRQVGSKWKATSLIDDSEIGTFATSKSAVKASLLKLDKQFNEIVDATDEAVRSGFASDVILRQNLKGTVKNVDLDEKGVIRMFHPDIDTGNVSPNKVKAAIQSVLRKQGAADDVVNKVEVKSVSPKDYWKKGAQAKSGNTYYVPRSVRTPDEHVKYFKRTLKEIDNELGTSSKSKQGTRPIREQFQTEIESAGYSPALAGYMSENLYPGSKIIRGRGKQMKLITQGGDEMVFASNRELGEFLYRKTLQQRPFTELELRQFLKHEHGITLKQKGHPDGRITYQAVRGNKVIAEGDFRSASDFIERAGRITDAEGNVLHISDETLRPKLPVDLAPISIVDNNLDELVVQGAVVRGPMHKIYDLSENFKDYSRVGRTKTIKSGEYIPHTGSGQTAREARRRVASPGSKIELDVNSKEWEVFLPEYNHRKTFSSIKEAREWISKAKDAPHEISDIALEKGARVSFANGQFMVQSVDPNFRIKTARNTAELKEIIRQLPDTPEALRELTGLSDATVQAFRKEFSDIMPHPESAPKFFSDQDFLDHVKKMRPSKRNKVYASSLYRPVEAQFKEMSNYLKSPELYENVYRAPVKGAEAYRAAGGQIDRQLSQLYKGIPEQRKKILSQFFELSPENNYQRWYKLADDIEGFELTQGDINVINRTREFLTEFGNTWGVEPWKFINEYLPKIRHYVTSPKFNPGDNGYDVLRKALGMRGTVPKELDYFARHLRAADFEAIAREWDIEELVRSYTHTAIKKQVMGESLETAKRFLNENMALFQDANEGMLVMSHTFLQRMAGMQMTSVMEQNMRAMSSEFAQTFAASMNKHGIKPMAELAPAMEDMVSFAQTLSVASLMAFRPYLPIRNMMQIWTTLAPRVGNETVLEAWKRVRKNPASAMKELVDEGLVTHRSPIQNIAGGQTPQNTRLHRFTEAGMVPFRNSDDMTRAVVIRSVDALVDDAAARFAKSAKTGKDIQRFMKLSSIDVLDPIDQRRIMTLLNDQGVDAAKREYKRVLVNETMFPYRQAENPEVFQGVVGRVFGHFGHYSVNFLENVRRMLRYNPAKTMGTLALNSTALVYAFEKVMGVSAYSFRPLHQMFFTGGPMYTAFNNTLTVAAGGWQATRLAGESPQDRMKFIWEQWSRILVPGSMRLYNARRALEFMNNGDYYEGIMRLASFPMIDPDLKE